MSWLRHLLRIHVEIVEEILVIHANLTRLPSRLEII